MFLTRRYGLLMAALVTVSCGPEQSAELGSARPASTSDSSADIESNPGQADLSAESVGDGSRIDPFANSRVECVVLIFVNTDCPIANRYAPTIETLYERYRARPVGFWLVFADGSATRQAIQEHLAAYKLQAPALRDPRHHLVEYCRATKTPEAVVFAPQRKLAYRGRIDDLFTDFGKRRDQPTTHDLRDAIDAVLEGRPVDPVQRPAIGCDIPRARS
jgi:hypothetical protein